MKFSIVTPNFNGARFLENALKSVLAQQGGDVELEYIVVDGDSTDDSPAILERHRTALARLIVERDHGPVDAINKGLRLATGEVLGWLNADDRYHPGALARVAAALSAAPRRALAFGRCRIVDENGAEIRTGITRFKEAFFPMSCRPAIQCINYVSQPAMWFRRTAWKRAGGLRADLHAAWDYEFLLRLWRQGGAVRVPGPPLSDFRWHSGSISGRGFERQFREEWEAARDDAGCCAPQTLVHAGVRWGIVLAYRAMARRRRAAAQG